MPERKVESSAQIAAETELPPLLAEAQAAGVDLAHLRHNLTLTPAQRLAQLQAGIRMFRTLRAARRLPALPESKETVVEPGSSS